MDVPRRKIPQDALAFYVSLGAERSYQKVAKEYGVTKRAAPSQPCLSPCP